MTWSRTDENLLQNQSNFYAKKVTIVFYYCNVRSIILYSLQKNGQAFRKRIHVFREARFFNGHLPANGLVNTARQFVMSQNKKYHFVKNLIDKLGYPYWDKAIVKESEPVANRGASETEGTVFIPFVPENDNTVQATMAVSIHQQDTSFRIIQNWQHRERIHGSMTNDSTAENVTALFMLLHKEVFGHKRFHITDPALFADLPVPPNRTGREIIIHDSPGETGRLNSQTFLYCFYGYVCGTPSNPACTGPNGCDYLNCPTGQCEATSTCVEFEVEEETGGGGPAGNGGGGTGGGGPAGGSGGSTGGGWIPPDNPCVPTQANNNCGQGWVPIELEEPTPPVTEPIDSLLKKAAQLTNKYRDSLASLCESEHKERFFNIVNYNNQLDTFRVLIGLSDNEVHPNYYMTGGRILKGSWHYHPKYSDGTPGSWPSGSDVTELYDKEEGFVMIIDTDNAR